MKDLAPMRKASPHDQSVKFRPRGNYFYYIMVHTASFHLAHLTYLTSSYHATSISCCCRRVCCVALHECLNDDIFFLTIPFNNSKQTFNQTKQMKRGGEFFNDEAMQKLFNGQEVSFSQ